jgi:GTP-binding protein Era
MDADVVLCVVDLTREPGEEDGLALELAQRCEVPRFLIMNKLDLVPDGGFRAGFEAQPALDQSFQVSALRGDGLPELLAAIVEKLPEGPPFFPTDQLTDVYEREVANDLIREAALGSLNQELPHAIAVKVEEWKERDNGMLYISALLIVERESQKGIVIGSGGKMLKNIGIQARQKLEGWLQKRVYLELQVKVMKKWRKNENALRWLGFVEGR